ncbi:MAG: DNA repair protein RecN [Phycicoccus sp.]|nr:DNA repair protein RecN [Phycicoccus sp.]NMM33310.1 DNA repair protein RecN [Phycicoccus sp.]
MLREIRIKNLGVIDDAVLELSAGLNVLTGETGAGKTMVVSGLGLLLGARADAGLVRTGASKAVVEGVVQVGPEHPATLRALEAGGDAEDVLILARTVSAEGRSKAHVGGRTVPVSVLGELGELLVAVHGQSDQWRLRQPEQHRVVLDRFAGEPVADPYGRYVALYDELHQVDAELRELRGRARDRAREVDVLRAGLEEIEAVDPAPGEDLDLRAEDERLAHADGLRASAGQAHALLTGDQDGLYPGTGRSDGLNAGDVGGHLATARVALAPMTAHDPALADLDRRLQELGYLAADLGVDLAAYLSEAEVDPARLAWVQDRRAELARLQRKYGDTIDDVLAWGKESAARLAELEGADDRADGLQIWLDTLRTDLATCAGELSAARRLAATDFGARVTTELSHLAMGKAVVKVSVARRPDPDGLPLDDETDWVRFGRHGVDEVEILLAANPGAPLRSVAKAASGGELSRVMLALEVVTGSGDVPTFVFDEVDAGVGGKAALDVGARLAALATSAQVIVVTHLAQVAAYADRHLVVRKTDDGHITASGVAAVTGQERLRELARMMGGVEDSDVAIEHAKELLGQASTSRQEAAEAGRLRT